MTNYTNFSNQDNLETFVNKAEQEHGLKAKFASLITNVVQPIIQILTSSNELQVWQGYDRFGNKVWHAYEPGTGKYTCVDSEAEMRVWLERRYYQ